MSSETVIWVPWLFPLLAISCGLTYCFTISLHSSICSPLGLCEENFSGLWKKMWILSIHICHNSLRLWTCRYLPFMFRLVSHIYGDISQSQASLITHWQFYSHQTETVLQSSEFRSHLALLMMIALHGWQKFSSSPNWQCLKTPRLVILSCISWKFLLIAEHCDLGSFGPEVCAKFWNWAVYCTIISHLILAQWCNLMT